MVVELALSALVQPTFVQISYWILESLALIFRLWHTGDRNADEQNFHNLFTTKGPPKTYNFIVVGSGSAGALVANRLVRNLHSVLLLEAGGEPMPLQYIPQFHLFMFNFPETDWQHKTVPQKRASLNSVNAQSSWSAGKVLGGTGTINAFTYLRGHPLDFENWANITDDPSWSWEGVLPYFKKYEDYQTPGQEKYHGYGGELRLETPDVLSVAPQFLDAAKELGFPQKDLNGDFGSQAFDFIKYPIRFGRRIGVYKAFLEHLKYMPLLTILKYAHVNKVLFRDNRAIGVQFDRHGKTVEAYASKEVILCAGTMGCEDEMQRYYEHATDRDSCHVIISGGRPLSRGYLKLGGNSPYDNLIIDPNYLGDESDVDFKVLFDGVKTALHLMENTTSMGLKVGARFTTEKLPGCEHLEFRSDAYWECYIRRYSITLHHPVGSTSMGQVVDSSLRVLGTRNLRVMDNGIQPVIVTPNTQASAIMIGEKGVDMVLRYWSKLKKEKSGA